MKTGINYWRLLADVGILYGADIHMIQKIIIQDGIQFRVRQLEFNGKVYSSAKDIWESLNCKMPVLKY